MKTFWYKVTINHFPKPQEMDLGICSLNKQLYFMHFYNILKYPGALGGATKISCSLDY